MTDEDVADVVYIEPLTVEVVERIIARERPGRPAADARRADRPQPRGRSSPTPASSSGTACGCSARRSQRSSKAEDRELFKQLLREHRRAGARERDRHARRRGARVRASASACRWSSGPAYTLGGTGGGIAHTDGGARAHRRAAASHASPIGQVLRRALAARLERDRVRGDARRRRHLHHHLQHGELRPDGRPHRRLIVVAPCQTLSDNEYQMLRSAALKIIRALDRGRLQRPVRARSRTRSTTPSSRSTRASAAPRRSPPRRPATRSPASPPRSPSAGAWTRSTNASPARRPPPSSRRSTTASSRSRAGRSTSSRRGDRTLGTQMKATGEVMAIDRSLRGRAAEGGALARDRRARSRSGRTRPGPMTQHRRELDRSDRTTCACGR